MKRRYNVFQFSSLSLAAMGAIVAIVVMTLVAELNGGFKGFLADLTGHHWVTKGLLALGIFLVIWLVSALGYKEETGKIKAWTWATVGVSILGMATIFFFFLNHFLAA